MKHRWPMRQLDELCYLIGGGTPNKSRADFYGGHIPWATVRDMHSDVITDTEFRISADAVRNSATNVIPSGSVVIATRVGLGKVCTLEADTAINQDLRGIVPKNPEEISTRYLFWWFRSITNTIIDAGTGATVQGVKNSFVSSLRLPLPPLPEQQRIVRILDEAFEGIATATANAERNLANAREMFVSALDRRFLSAPAHWQHRPLGTVCAFSGGSQPPKSEFSKIPKPGYVRLIQIRDYKSDKHIIYVDQNDVSKFCEENDVMIGRYGPPLFQILRGLKGAYNVALMKTVPNEEFLSKAYLYYFLRNSKIMNHVIMHSDRAAGQTGIKREVLEGYEICFPELEEQDEIVHEFGELEQTTNTLTILYQRKLKEISDFQQALLHKAFSSEFTGNDVITA
jgi:type I restriction enzyme S subunit